MTITDHTKNYRKNVERRLEKRGRKVVVWCDDEDNVNGEPIHRPMTAYEKFARVQKNMGEKPIDEDTFNLGLFLLGKREGLHIINAFKK